MTINLNQIIYNRVLNNKLNHNKIITLFDLITKKPKRYEDYTLTKLSIENNEKEVFICGLICSKPKIFKKKVFRIHFQVKIFKKNNILDNNFIEVVIFNRLYLIDLLKVNHKILVKGKYFYFANKIIAGFVTTNLNMEYHIQPIYNLKDISDKMITNIIKKVLLEYSNLIQENLPINIVKKYHLIKRLDAFKHLHLPNNMNDIKLAFKRFKYEEAFQINNKWLQLKKKLPIKEPLEINMKWVKNIIKTIPFELTLTQKKTVNDIYLDFKKKYQVQRLIQGDVGTGKTIVAFIAALGVIIAKKQVLMMAPTEILAQQHYKNFTKLFPFVKTVILTSKNKNKLYEQEQIKLNTVQMVIGTHILSSIDFFSLGLVIIDEQHKFGFELKQQTVFNNQNANIIYLSATPIPKTLIFSYLGYIETSIIQKEVMKKNVVTQHILKDDIFSILKNNQQNNLQTYMVAPLIEDNQKYFSISQIALNLKKANINNLYILHGKQKKDEQEHLIDSFTQDHKGILLATTIIEVGIDIKDVNTIIILGANYFGLSQLHQLRGRVGRGNKKGYCYLVSDKDNERLKILQKEYDGFKLSFYDLQQRGPGEFLGFKQSGYFKHKFLIFPTDLNILSQIKMDLEKYE